MLKKFSVFSLVIMTMVFISFGNATTHPVAVGESINSAIAGAAAGDTISVAAGTFTETVTVGTAVVIIGQGADQTIVQAQEVDPTTETGIDTPPVFFFNAEPIVLRDMTVRHAQKNATSHGAGIEIAGGKDDCELINLHVTRNKMVNAKRGAGVASSGARLLIDNCAIDYNQGHSGQTGSAVAIIKKPGTVILNSTISNNTGFEGVVEFWQNAGHDMSIINCTIVDNDGGLFMRPRNSGEAGTYYLQNNIIANNTAYDIELMEPATQVIEGDYNIVGDTVGVSGELLGTNNIYDVSSLNLAPDVAENNTLLGIPTIALNPGSVAIDAGDASSINGVDVPLNDARGYARISPFDIGAFEYGADGAPAISVTAPNGGEIWLQGASQNITWVSDNVTNVKLDYSTDDGATWTEIATLVDAALESYTWTLPVVDSPNCLVKISDAADDAAFDVSDAPFSIVAPFITVTAPNGGNEWQVGQSYDITWEYGFVTGNASIEYTNGDDTWSEIAASVDIALGSFSWTIPNDLSSTCLVRITSLDFTTITDDSDAAFSIVLPMITIAEARLDGDADYIPDNLGAIVHIIGTVTSPDYGGYYRLYYIQDATAGITLHANGTDLNLSLGDEVEVFGEVNQYNGLTQVVVTAADVTILSSGNPRESTLVNLDQIGEATEGSFVKVDDVYLVDPTDWPAEGSSASVDLTDGTTTVTLRIDSDTGLDGWFPPQGMMNIKGVVGQYDSSDPFDSGYQLLGTIRWDIMDMGVGGNLIEVVAGEFTLSNAVAMAGARDILVLTTDGGMYTDTTILIDRPLTIKAADGLSEKPILEFAYDLGDETDDLIRAWADLTVEGVIFGQADLTGAVDTLNNPIVYSDRLMDFDQPGINKLIVDDVDFRNTGNAIRQQFLEANSDATKIDSVMITNSTFIDLLFARPLDFTGDFNNPTGIETVPAVNYALVEDCSFINLNLPIRFNCSDDGTDPSVMIINHNTFFRNTNNRTMKIEGGEVGTVVKNNIYVEMARWGMNKLLGDVYPDTLYNSGWYDTDYRLNDNFDGTLNCLDNINPLFADTSVYDLTLSSISLYVGAADDGTNIGDRNWGTYVANTAPVITDIPAQFTGEDTALVVPIVAIDAEEDPLTYSATSDEANVVPSFLVDAMLTLTPTANWSGSATITVVVSDGVLADTTSFVLVVGPVDDLPVVVNPFDDAMVDEDAADLMVGDLDTVFIDIDGTLIYEYTSGNPDLVTASIDDGLVTLQFLENAYGSTEMIFIASNPLTRETASDTMMVTVNAINDAPYDFALNTPVDATTVTITATTLSDTLWFTWTDFIDVDGDELDINVTGTDELEFLVTDLVFLGDTTAYITYSALLAVLPDDGTASGSWNMSISDAEYDVNASNGPFTLTIDATAVGIHPEGLIPDVFILDANYPNPFNPVTTLVYGLPEASQVMLTIYDLKGRLVSTLVNSSMEAGYHTAIWNGTNQQGQPVGAGVYIYRIQTREFGQARKMILLK